MPPSQSWRLQALGVAVSLHALWRRLPHGARRRAFDRLALILGRYAAGTTAGRWTGGPVVVAGVLRSPTGLGEAARLLIRGLQAVGRDVRAIDLTEGLKQPAVVSPPPCPSAEPGPGALIVVANPPVSSLALWLIGRQLIAGKVKIGHLVWEYDNVPHRWPAHARLFDVVAAPSAFCRGVFERAFAREIVVLPYPAALGRHVARRPVEANGSFRIGFAGDLIAAAGRKNPLACVEAVARAFPHDESVTLDLILGGGIPGHPVRAAVEARAKALGVALEVDARPLDAEEHALRLASHHAYLSLHRCEGFGLTVVEALLAGCPVVATGAPPIDEILTAETGYPVGWRSVPAAPLVDIDAPGNWAEPDIDEAAAALRRIRSEPAVAEQRARAAQAALSEAFGAEAFAARLDALLPS